MHDRRIKGEALVFGNQGALISGNMTWWDHNTESIWSQLLGQAIVGPLAGAKLELVPMNLVPWETWREQHPNTLVLAPPPGNLVPGFGEPPRDGFVIGIELGDASKGYPFSVVKDIGLVNDFIGGHPVLVFIDPETRSIHTYLRQVSDTVLTFQLENGRLVDEETDTQWDASRGGAVEGRLKGEFLRQVPYVTAFRWAWEQFYPDTAIYLPD